MPLFWVSAKSGRIDHVREGEPWQGRLMRAGMGDDDYTPALCGAEPLLWQSSRQVAEPGVATVSTDCECKKCRKALDGRTS